MDAVWAYLMGCVLLSPLLLLPSRKGLNKGDAVPVKAKEDLLYIRGILRKRFDNKINDRVALELLTAAYMRGVKIEDLTGNAKNVASWDAWVKGMVVNEDDSGIGNTMIDRAFPGGKMVPANGQLFGDNDD